LGVQKVDSRGAVDIFVPGRLCLFGEHSDWAGEYSRSHNVNSGRTIVIGTEQGLYCRASPLPQSELIISSVTVDGQSVGSHVMDLSPAGTSLLEQARMGGFWAYVAGTAHKLCTEHMLEGGLRIENYRTTLPFKKGLSSSAAICVMVARAFNLVFGLKLSTLGEMEYAYRGERLTPSMCGRMDQCGAFGQVPMLMTFEGDSLGVQRLALGAPLYMVLVDLLAGKDTVAILAALQGAYPEPQLPAHEALHRLLGPTNERITSAAVALLSAGDARGLGALMREAQQEFDHCAQPLAPDHLASPVLHAVLAYPAIQNHIWGGKGVGSQGDGTAQLVTRGPEDQEAVCRILEEQLRVSCSKMTLQATNSFAARPPAQHNTDPSGFHTHQNAILRNGQTLRD